MNTALLTGKVGGGCNVAVGNASDPLPNPIEAISKEKPLPLPRPRPAILDSAPTPQGTQKNSRKAAKSFCFFI